MLGIIYLSLQRAKREGAELLTGGSVPAHVSQGFFVQPTVFTHVRPDMQIWCGMLFDCCHQAGQMVTGLFSSSHASHDVSLAGGRRCLDQCLLWPLSPQRQKPSGWPMTRSMGLLQLSSQPMQRWLPPEAFVAICYRKLNSCHKHT